MRPERTGFKVHHHKEGWENESDREYKQVRHCSTDSVSRPYDHGFLGTAGISTVVSYATKICETDLVAEVKWLPELDTKHRLNGDYIWSKVAPVF